MTESTSRQRRRWNESPNLIDIGSPRAPAPVRYGSQFPDINLPRHMEGTLVPVQGRKSTPRFREDEGDERYRQVELRLGVAEKSYRALLEELLRLQNDMQTAARRSEEIFRDEKGARLNLESALKISNELISALSARIKDTEEKLQEERSILSSLVNHTKGVEQAVKSSQNELLTKKDIQGSKLSEMRMTMDDLNHNVSQQERQAFQMSEDIRVLKMKVESQSAEFASVSNDLKSRSKKLEDDNRLQLESLRKQNSLQSQTEQVTQNLRSQVETRLAELRDVLMELRNKQEGESAERRNMETSTSQRMHELQQQIADANRKRDETIHAMEIALREKDHSTQADRMTLASKVADSVEDINKKLLSKELKIREEMQDRYLQLEKLIQQEQQQRREYERAARDDSDRKIQQIKGVQDVQSAEIKELVKSEKGKNKETMNKLDDSITILEKHVMETRKSLEKLIAAEISQRKIYDKEMNEKLANVNEKLQIATSTLQQSIGGMSQTVQNHNEKMRREMRTMLGEQKEATTRGLADLDARINFNKNRMHDLEERIESRVAAASQTLSENLREKVDSIALWQETTGSTVKELSLSVQRLPDEIYSLQEKQTLMKSDMNTRMTAESDARVREVENLKQELQQLKMKREPQAATIHDVENVQASLRKLADSIQTVKTVLGMKIQSEQKLRVDGLEDLQTQINQLKVNVGMPNYGHKPSYLKRDPLDLGLGSAWDDPVIVPEVSNKPLPPKDIDTRTESSGGATTRDTGYGTATDTQMSIIPEGRESNHSPAQQSVRSQVVSPTKSLTGKVSPTKSAGSPVVSKTVASPTPSKTKTPAPNSRNQSPAISRAGSVARKNSLQKSIDETLADV